MSSLSVAWDVHFHRHGHGAAKELRAGTAPEALPAGRVPRVARLMALALRFEGLLRRGEVKDYATLARLGNVTRARISQIMNLLHLAPDIQEALLFLALYTGKRAPVLLADLQPLTALPDWARQRRRWREVCAGRRLPAATAGESNGGR